MWIFWTLLIQPGPGVVDQATRASGQLLEYGVLGAVLVLAIIGIAVMYHFTRKDMKAISGRHAAERAEWAEKHAEERAEWREEDGKRLEMWQEANKAQAQLIRESTDALTQLGSIIDERIPKRRGR